MAKLDARLHRKRIRLGIDITLIDNGWIFEIGQNGIGEAETEILVARSRSELNELINKLPINLINRVNSELMEDSS